MQRSKLQQEDRSTSNVDADNNNVFTGSDIESNVDIEQLVTPSSQQQQQQQLLPAATSFELDEPGNNNSKSNNSMRTYAVEERKAISQSRLLAVCVIILGITASGAFVGLGISSLRDTENATFDRFANDLYHKLRAALVDYSFAANMIHARCRSRNFTRLDFRDLYEYIIGDDLDVQAIDFKPRVLRDERAAYESEAREYYATYYPEVNYTGFTGFNYDNSTKVEPRNQADVYYPVQYHEPITGNEKAAGLDFYASGSRRRAIDECLRTGKPSISDRLTLVQEKVDKAYGVVILHPGVNVTSQRDIWPHDLASIVIRIPDLLKRSTMYQEIGTDVYLFDKLQSATFLGAIRVRPYDQSIHSESVTLLPEIAITELPKNTWRNDIPASNKVWCLAIVPSENTFNSATVFVILGGITIFFASVFIAFNVHTKTHQILRYNTMKRDAEIERATLILENTKKSAKSELELNDFIAHEVRNPVAAAMAACSFVERTSIKDRSSLDDESWDVLRGDVQVISNALHFINDLLRAMLDMHRATSQQLVVKLASVHVMNDILEPVQSILYTRGNKVQLYVDCDTALHVLADKLRLKQVILNLGRNSTKFVETGFIRFTAKKLPGEDTIIEFAVEDSGPGIPVDKRQRMFTKYQDSLDGLAQGTVSY
jgi:signal transduction histidine kinase